MNSYNETAAQMCILGKAPDQAIKNIANRMSVSKGQAGRLVMTEAAYFGSVAQKDCFNDLDVEQYEIVGTLDISACDICGNMDGKAFDMKDFQAGVTAPPFHPRCRCFTAPHFEDEDGVGERYARDVETGEGYMLPKDTTYQQWKAMQDEKYGAGTVDKKRKMWYNTSEDKKQFEAYNEWLGSNAPQTFEKFQKLKYSDNWLPFKAYTQSIKTGELTPLADFKLYTRISTEIDEKIVGVTTSNGIFISGKSNHSIARTIGSVEQRRNGVAVSDILDALTNSESEILPVKEMKNGKSQKFRNKVVEVSVNPDTGNIIQVNPVHTRRKVKS